MNETNLLDDIIFITLPDSPPQQSGEFTFNPAIPLPVQLSEGQHSINKTEGVRIESIAAGLIRVIAHQHTHSDIDYFKQMLTALQPDVVHELQLGGIAKANNGELEFAEELFLAACHLNPHIPEIFVNLAILYAQRAKQAMDANKQEELDKALTQQVEILKEGLQHNPLSDLLLAESGMVHLYLGNDEIAFKQLNEYLKIAPDGDKRETIESRVEELSTKLESERLLLEAYDEMHLANEEQALSLISTFIELNPKAWSGYFIKGWALRRLSQYEEAQQALLEALKLGEENGDIYNELSICALELGQKELASEYLAIALEFDGENITLLTNLALLRLREENYNEAEELLARAEAIDPKDPSLLYLKEEITRRLGQLVDEEEVIDG